MEHDSLKIIDDNGVLVSAKSPVIISASRSTDIPTFYSDWFVERWRRGYVRWQNPFNGSSSYISFQKTRLVVFWTKNPRPMFKNLTFIEDNIPNFYFQFSLNDYDTEGLEGKVPALNSRIDSFLSLAERIKKEKVIWRFDPLILTDKLGVHELLRKVENIGNRLKGSTEKLVFSFIDLVNYRKVQKNLLPQFSDCREFNEAEKLEFASGLIQLNKNWGFQLSTCTEGIDLSQFEISHNKCIDDDLIIKLFRADKQLMDYLGVSIAEPSLFSEPRTIVKIRNLKDKGQRTLCGCIQSKDIGQYNTCPHECLYCYANTSIELAKANYKSHLKNATGEVVAGI